MQTVENVTSQHGEATLLCEKWDILILVITTLIFLFGFIGNLITASKVIIEKKVT